MKNRSYVLTPLCLVMTVAAAVSACSSAPEDDGTSESQVVAARGVQVAELFGNDRMGQLLKGHPERSPHSFAEYEEMFQVGRKCPRTDSKEIFVVEEGGTRDDDGSSQTATSLPRVVVTGCNTDIRNPESVRLSYGMMAALVSTDDPRFATDPARGDTLVSTPLEVMALDETTGLYNFYKFFTTDKTAPPTVLRVERGPDDKIYDIVWKPGDTRPFKKPSARDDGTPTRRCFSCHATGAPIMNELRDPWTNWVSFRHNTLNTSKMSGMTLDLVNESVLNAGTGRSSLARQLEETITAGMRAYVLGVPTAPDSGYAKLVVNGTQPGGLSRLLRSSFCQTDVNYASAFDTVPVELFFDPAAIAAAAPRPPLVNPSDVFPRLLPMRSEMDRRIENSLVRSGYLTANTVLAIRLFDEVKDIFSDDRCKLLDAVSPGLPSVPAEVDAHVRRVLAGRVAQIPAGARREYVVKLLAAAPREDLDAAKAAYAADVAPRLEAKFKLLDSEEGRRQLHSADLDRKAAVFRAFPLPNTPAPQDVLVEGSAAAAAQKGFPGDFVGSESASTEKNGPSPANAPRGLPGNPRFEREPDFTPPK